MPTVKETPAEIVSRALGVRGIARELKLTPGAVSKWKKSGLVPSRYHASILAISKRLKKGLTADSLICTV